MQNDLCLRENVREEEEEQKQNLEAKHAFRMNYRNKFKIFEEIFADFYVFIFLFEVF